MLKTKRTIKISYKKIIKYLHKGQKRVVKAVLKDNKRYIALMCHRRYGKDFIALLILVLSAIQHKGNYYIYAPFMKQAKEIVVDGKTFEGTSLLETLIPKELLLKAPQNGVVNKTDWSITLINGSKIFIRGADNPNSAVGIGARGMVFTEAALMKPGFYQYMKPAIDTVIDKTGFGFVMFISTPRGRHNWFTKLFTDYFTKISKNPLLKKDWYIDVQKASSSKAWNGAPVISTRQLEKAKLEHSEEMFEQEYECSLNLALVGSWYSKYIDKAFKEKRIGRFGVYANVNDEFEKTVYQNYYFKHKPVYVAWDIGRRDHTVLWFFQVNPDNGRIRFIHHYREKGEGALHFINYIKNWISNKQLHLKDLKCILPHDGDVTEWATETKRSDFIFQQGLDVFTLTKTELAEVNMQSLLAQINTVRRLFDKVEIDNEECALGVIKLQEYVKKFNKSTGEYLDMPDHNKNDKASDDADSFRVAIMYYSIYLLPLLSNIVNNTYKEAKTYFQETMYYENRESMY